MISKVAVISQRMVVDCGSTARYTAISIHNKNKNAQLLKAYFTNNSIIARAWPWQQIVACLMRNYSYRIVEYQLIEA